MKLKYLAEIKNWPMALMLGFLRLVVLLPYAWQMQIGAALGWVVYWLSKHRRHITEVNLRLCFPEKSVQERTALAKASFRSAGQGMMEGLMSWWIPPERLLKRVNFHNKSYYDAAIKRGKGIILVGAHFTSLELLGCLCAAKYKNMAVVYRGHKNPLFDDFMRTSREKHYTSVIERTDMRELMRTLKKNHAIFFLADQDYGAKHSLFVPFFGISTAMITSVSRIARSTGAAVMPIVFHRRPDCKGYEGSVLPMWENFPSGDDAADAKRMSEFFEQTIRDHPEQYLWQHRRFKTRPEGEARPY